MAQQTRTDPGRFDDSCAGYELVPETKPPRLPGVVTLRATAGEALDALVADVMAQSLACVRMFGDFHMAVGGDASMEALYLRMMSDPDLRAMPWEKTHLWLTHERRVEEGNSLRVYSAVQDFLIEHSGIPIGQTHPMPVECDDADVRYEHMMRTVMSARETYEAVQGCATVPNKGRDASSASNSAGRLDCVIIAIESMGRAGGRAVLAPEVSPRTVRKATPPLGAGAKWCEWVDGASPMELALTRSFINASRLIVGFALGEEKRAELARLASSASAEKACTLRPIAGELRWYVDEAAAGR